VFEKVLVIDNAPMVHTLVRARLGSEELDIRSALSGHDGLALATTFQPDVILLDVHMPDPDGFEVCRRLKADPATANIPVIFLTAEATPAQKAYGLNLGAVDYVTKPFDGTELKARVRASLRTKFMLDLLAKRAMIDGLTGLWNRAYFDQRLASELALSKRHGQPLSCLMLDADYFKSINDTYGHPAGDAVLRRIAGLLAERARAEDVACRYGGEEFGMIMPNTTAANAGTFARRLLAGIESLMPMLGGAPVRVTCSIGVADVNGVADQLLDAADAALYRAKRGGRNRVVLHGDSNVAAA
jgi:two-component system cell cycle response regulator